MLLNRVPPLSSAALHRLLVAFGGVEGLWRAGAEALQQAGRISPALAERIAQARSDEAGLREELALARRCGAAIVTWEDDAYPAPLRSIADPPPVLYVKGALASDAECAVAIVGSRHASAYGLQCAGRLGYDLALRGVAVVSGLARGIDTAAHEGALKAGGRTLAVLGSGLAQVYPPEHEPLAEQIAAQGAVLSEYPMAMSPHALNFPRRNRIISGLSLGVVVVEAAQRSGALITADCALEQGREVFAVPGPMTADTSAGTHRLLKQGARLVTSVEDILEELRLAPQPAGAAPLTQVERQVLACVGGRAAQDIDTIAATSGVGASAASTVLLQLELKGFVTQRQGKRFVRKAHGVTSDT
ncbi:MAG: DNA-protecting protein DprA [Candidatus Omnitrophica bacterium]|nr:DNA-protecting protein DprA [Candidatus Omnitrophota bacterium]